MKGDVDDQHLSQVVEESQAIPAFLAAELSLRLILNTGLQATIDKYACI